MPIPSGVLLNREEIESIIETVAPGGQKMDVPKPFALQEAYTNDRQEVVLW